METLQNLRPCISLAQLERMSTTTCPAGSYAPESRPESHKVSRSLGGYAAGALHPLANRLEVQAKDLRPHGPQLRQSPTATEVNNRLDTSGPQRVDKCPQPTHPAIVNRGGSDAAANPSQPKIPKGRPNRARPTPDRPQNPCRQMSPVTGNLPAAQGDVTSPVQPTR